MKYAVTTKRIDGESIIEYLKDRLYMKRAGFKVDKKRDVYVKPGYGAWYTNLISGVNIELLRYSFGYEFINRKGYNYVLGPGAPSLDDGKVECPGLYLTNYEEMFDREKTSSDELDYIRKEEPQRPFPSYDRIDAILDAMIEDDEIHNDQDQEGKGPYIKK